MSFKRISVQRAALLATVAVALIAGSALSGCAQKAAAPDHKPSAGTGAKAAVGNTSAFIRAPMFPEQGQTTLADASAAMDPRIVLPGEMASDGVVAAATVPNGGSTLGIALKFKSGATMVAGPLAAGQEPIDYKALQAREVADGVTFTDGRKQPGEIRDVNGRETLVQAAGIQVMQKGGNVDVPAVVMWHKNGINYFLTSENTNAPVEALVAIAKSIP